MGKNISELSYSTLIKRVMSGIKKYRSEEYLIAFSKIPSYCLFVDSVYSTDVICLWNSLQNTPKKTKYFTFSLVHQNHLVQQRIKKFFSSEKYAYICHDKDTSAEHKHFHYVLLFNSSRSFSSVANDLGIPVTMLQKVFAKKGILDYLTHENDPDKYHYSLDSVTANFDLEQEKKDDAGFPFKEFYHDYCLIRSGDLSVDDFIDKYNMYCSTLRLPTALQLAERLYFASSAGASLSTRSNFHGRTPVRSPQFQPSFPGVDPNNLVILDDGSMYSNPLVPRVRSKRRDYRKPNPRSDLADDVEKS